MSQPPWENRPQQGWGPPAQPQQPGWNQDPYPQSGHGGYPQQHPAQYPAQQGGPGYDDQPYDPYAQQRDPYPPQHDPYAQREQYPPREHYPPGDRGRPDRHDYPPEPPRRGGGSRTAGIVGVCMLLVIGVATGAVMLTRHSGSGTPTAQSTPDATASASDTASSDPFPSGSLTDSPSSPNTAATTSGSAPSHGASSSAPAVTSPAMLDSAATDTTPFTPAALFAKKFTDEKNVAYTLKAAAPKPCDKVGDAVVAPIVRSAKCTQFMAASWIDASGRIVVSAMVIPYQDAATAKKIQDKLGNAAHTGDYNQWCPPAGQPGADVCTKLTPTATREGMAGAYHRYMLITTAVFVDLRTDPGQAVWLSSAANGAFQNILPGS